MQVNCKKHYCDPRQRAHQRKFQSSKAKLNGHKSQKQKLKKLESKKQRQKFDRGLTPAQKTLLKHNQRNIRWDWESDRELCLKGRPQAQILETNTLEKKNNYLPSDKG